MSKETETVVNVIEKILRNRSKESISSEEKNELGLALENLIEMRIRFYFSDDGK